MRHMGLRDASIPVLVFGFLPPESTFLFSARKPSFRPDTLFADVVVCLRRCVYAPQPTSCSPFAVACCISAQMLCFVGIPFLLIPVHSVHLTSSRTRPACAHGPPLVISGHRFDRFFRVLSKSPLRSATATYPPLPHDPATLHQQFIDQDHFFRWYMYMSLICTRFLPHNFTFFLMGSAPSNPLPHPAPPMIPGIR